MYCIYVTCIRSVYKQWLYDTRKSVSHGVPRTREIYRNYAKKACASSRIQSVVFPKERRAMCSCRISSGASLQSETYAKKKMRFVYIIGTKKKETPVCNGVSFFVSSFVDKSIFFVESSIY